MPLSSLRLLIPWELRVTPTISGKGSRVSDGSNKTKAVAAAILSEAASSASGKMLSLILLGTPLGPFAEIAGSVTSAAVKSVLEQFSRQNARMAAQLDSVLAEPLRFALDTLKDNLSIAFATKAGFEERERQLKEAFDKLRTAYIYAESKDSSTRSMIRALQALTAASYAGAREYVPLYLSDFKAASALARNEAEQARAGAADIDPDWFYEHWNELIGTPIDYSDAGYRAQGIVKATDDAREKKASLQGRAIELDKAADLLDRFCLLVTSLAKESSSANLE